MLIRNSLLMLAAVSVATAEPVINEIHFHPQGAPEEKPAQEWIEILNPDAAPVDVSGWRLSKGVTFTIPATPSIPAGGFLVIAANVVAFDAANPDFAGTRVGGWTGRLSNGGEQIQLDDALGLKVNDVTYADEGDWGVRARGSVAFGAAVLSVNIGNEQITTTAPHGFSTGQFASVATSGTFPASTPSLSGGTTHYYVRSVSTTVLRFYTTLSDANADTNPVDFTGSSWTGAFVIGHKGWIWENDADGGGKTLELRNPALGNASGQNWGVSVAPGGSPGAANSINAGNIAPLIKDSKHRPEVPSSSEEIIVSCDLEDEAPGATATLHWRLDGAPSFATLPMSDTDGDGDVEASIPSQANLAIVEWYISATDGTNTRTWPKAARTSDPGVLPETFGQVTNALVLVDNSFSAAATFLTPSDSPVYRIIMLDADRDELVQIGTTNGQQESLATFNTTFTSHDGTGVRSIHNCGTRNRGGGDTALGPPNNYSVSFRSDDSWNNRGGITINAYYPHSQALGNTLFTRAGSLTQEAAIVRVRLNGVDMAETGARMLGRYARLEGRNSEWAARHFPGDSEGNFYRVDDHFPTTNGVPAENLAIGEFRYEGANQANYADSYFKETNQDANDYSDMLNFTRIISAPATGGTAGQPAISDAAYPAAVATVLDVDAFYRFIATDALIGNQEGGLQSGRADDVSMYRGVVDPRFRFVAHDMDDVFGLGNGAGDGETRSLFSYDEQVQQGNTGVVGLTRLFNHPALVPRYYAAVLDAMNTWFNNATIDPIVDNIMAGWVPGATVTNVKAFVGLRRANVLSQIQQNYSLVVTAGGTAIEGNPRTTNGGATFSGTFNVARTYSITVNGVLATWSYRNTGAAAGNDDAGEWFLTVPAGGGGVLSPGLNTVVVRFWGGLGATGAIVNEITQKVIWEPTTAVYTNVSGTLAPSGSLAITAPADYIPGIPFLVRVDLKDGAGNLDRTAWNRTATLTATNGVTLTPNTVTLTNGMGSTLVTVGGGGTTVVPVLTMGTGGTGGAIGTVTGTPGSTWKYRTDFTDATLPAFVTASGATWMTEGFDDSTWPSGPAEIGYGNTDENWRVARTDYAATVGTQSGPCYLFRGTFNIASAAAVSALTGTIRYDDAYRIYVNGTYVTTSAGMTQNSLMTAYSTANPGDNSTAAVTIPVGLLHDGVNTIAVEIHQNQASSGDITLNLALNATITSGAADPGNFTLTSTIGALNASKAIASLTPTPAMTNVAGTLPSGVTNWSGVMNVTGDVTVPSDGTLEIAAGTTILMAGDSTAGSTAGADLIVTTGGIVNATGTLAQPISITGNAAPNRWGEINVNGATTTWQYCLVTHAAHSPGGGHTGTGPAFRLSNGAVWTFDDGAITDLPGKTLTNTGNTTMTYRRSHFARCVMGPETDNSTTTIEDCNFTEMLPVYRESGSADDEDSIYIHNGGNQPVNLRRSVFSNSGDDGIDLLAGAVTIEDCIVRNILDKGMSLLQNNVTVRRTQIVDCDFCVSTKTQLGSEATPYTLTMENCTLIGEVHATNQGDQSGGVYWHSVGVHVRDKYVTAPNPQLIVNMKNCIVSAVTPMLNDYPIVGNDFPLLTSTYNDYEDVAGTNPVDPAVPAGTGDIAAVPLFVDATNKDFHLQAASPARNTGDPASPLDADGSRADMGALPFGTTGGGGGSLVWTPAGGPYRVTANATVPAGLTLTIQAGTAVYFDQNIGLTVNGNLQVLGTPDKRVVFSSVPGAVAAGDADPIKEPIFNSVEIIQTGPPKWAGVRIYDSMAVENVVKYADFINAQGTSPSGSENYGSLGFIRSWGFCEGLTFAGTHLRMLYGRNPKLTVIRCVFPDMMIFDPLLPIPNTAPQQYGRIEDNTDFITAADNSMEPLKVEYPVEAASTGAAWTTNGLPIGGWWRVYYNQFNGNRGHNDVFDADSGSMAITGDFLLDCRYNHFRGLSGDEHIDLGGDAYIASNIFEAATKDQWVSAFGTDNGYSNAISSGDKGTGTTIMVVRNTCYDLDHVINCKAGTAAIFEHNTVSGIHADYTYTPSTPDQNVKCAPINFFVPEDGNNPTRGDGAYMGFNLISNVPRLFSGPDARKILSDPGPPAIYQVVNDVTTKIEFFHNQLDGILDPIVGPNHPDSAFSGSYGPNIAGAPGFVNPGAEDYSLTTTSLARRSAPGGIDYGATVPEWAYILGGPVGTTDQATATFTIGGPGILAYKWRLDGGAWSATEVIGTGGPFPRTVGSPCVRQEALVLSGLTPGTHTLEVLGRDMAGNWQDNDPARTVIGAAQAGPTVRTWTVDTAAPLVRISEVLANPVSGNDVVELHNFGSVAVNVGGWSLTDDALVPAKLTLPATSIPAGGYATFSGALLALDADGDSALLFQGATQRDAITFGRQLSGISIGRGVLDNALAWRLGTPTPGAANTPVLTGDHAGIRISEWFSDGIARYNNDWVELSNSQAFPVDLAGLRITDNRADATTQFVFPPLTFIGASGFAKFASGNIGFNLDNTQDDLALYTSGGALLDNVVFFDQTTDYSQGIGGTFYELPTANLANTTTDANALALLRYLRADQIMYNAVGGSDYDYIQLTNFGPTPLQLQGVSFVQGIAFTFTNPTTLGNAERIIVVKNVAKFRSRYGNTPVVAGTYSGQLDNGGETLAIQLPPPFDANILTFSYSDGWYTATDGNGPALIRNSDESGVQPAHAWGDRDTWTTTTNGGVPGGVGARTDTFAGWMAIVVAHTVDVDDDQDTVPAVVEFTLGMNPADGNGLNGPLGLPVLGYNGATPATFTFDVPENPGAAQGHGFADTVLNIEASDDLINWTTIAKKTHGAPWTGNAAIGVPNAGYIPITITDTAPPQLRRFLRVNSVWNP